MAFDYGVIGKIKKYFKKRKVEKAFDRGKDSSPTEQRVLVPSKKDSSKAVSVPISKASQGTSTGISSGSSFSSSSRRSSDSSRSSGGVSQTITPTASVEETLKTMTQPKLTRENLTKKAITTSQTTSKGIYSPTRGQFETYRKDLYGQGTQELISTRLPTQEEKIKIDLREKYAATASQEKIKEDIGRLETLEEKKANLIEKYNTGIKGKVSNEGYFTGTTKEYDDLKKLERQIELSEQKIGSIDKTRTSIFFNYKREIPIKRLKTGVGQINVMTGTISKAAGEAAAKLGREEGYFKTGGKEVTITTPVFGTVQDYDPLTGKGTTDLKKQVFIEEKAIGTPEQFKKVGEGVVSTGKYFVPYVGGALAVSEIGEEVSRSGSIKTFVKEKPLESAFIGASVLTSGVLRGVSKVKAIKSKAIKEAIEKEMKILEGKPIKSLTIIDEGQGLVKAAGEVQAGKVTKRIEYLGEIMETEGGKKFVPTGQGGMVISGEAAPKMFGRDLAKRKFISGTEFSLGAKGKGVKVGEFGDVTILEELGTSTIIPKKEVFGAVKVKDGMFDMVSLGKQLEKTRPVSTEIIKDISLPMSQRNLLFQMDNVGLRASPQELGTIITIPKKADAQAIGFKGVGKKSSQEVFSNLYSQQEAKIIKPKAKVEPPMLGEISAKIKPTIPESQMKKTPSTWAGTGLYERTETASAGIFPGIKTEVKTKPTIPESQMKTFETVVEVKEEIKTKSKSRFKPRERMEIFQPTKQIQPIRESLKEKVKERTKIQELLKGESVLERETIQPQVFNQRTNTRTEIKQKTTPAKIPWLQDVAGKLGGEKRDESFKIFGKRFGEDILLGTSKTKKEAEKKLEKFLIGTLGRSGKIVKNDKVLPFEELSFGEMFRAAKKDKGRVVQKAKYSLGTKAETQEIQFFKKKPSRSKKNKNKFDWFS